MNKSFWVNKLLPEIKENEKVNIDPALKVDISVRSLRATEGGEAISRNASQSLHNLDEGDDK